jgi:predicted enzyme related to lactoylglutathione lyase
MKNLNAVRLNIMVSNMDRAIEFYIDKLELTLINRFGEHYAEIDANGFTIGLHPTNPSVIHGTAMSIGLGVFNFDETLAMLKSKGINSTLEKGGYIRLAHFKDADGNPLFIAENFQD